MKNVSSLLVAGAILLGILFLPPNTFERVNGLLKFLAKGQHTAPAFGNYLIQNAITGSLILAVTIVLSIAAERAVRGHFEEKRKQNIN